MKHIEKEFGRINIGNLDKIILTYALNYSSELILMCTCCPTGTDMKLDMEAKAP